MGQDIMNQCKIFIQISMGMLLLGVGLHVGSAAAGTLKAEEAYKEGVVGDGGGNDVIRHAPSLLQSLEALLALGNGSDVVLRVETPKAGEVKVIQAHSLVLALQSLAFEELVVGRNGGSPTTLVLKESDECAAVFEKFIRYLYCGELTVRLEQAVPLHELASKYRVQGLRQGLAQYMTQSLARASPPSHAVAWYEYARRAGDVDLRDSCLQRLAWNLSSLLRSEEWAGVSSQLLMALLRRSDLVLHSELELFTGLEAWIEWNRPDGPTAEDALQAVRYAMMPPRELFRLQAQSVVLARYHESVRDLLFASFQFHSAPPLHMAKYFDVNCSLFVPRNYLSPLWGSPWIIGNPTRDDRSTSFQTQLGPSGHDASKRVTWNALFSPRWMPLSARPMYGEAGAAMQPARAEGGRPRVIVTPATSSGDFAGVAFQKTVLVMAQMPAGGAPVVVRHIYDFHQSTEENGDFLAEADLHRRSSEYLVDNSLLLHVVVKPLYQSLVAAQS